MFKRMFDKTDEWSRGMGSGELSRRLFVLYTMLTGVILLGSAIIRYVESYDPLLCAIVALSGFVLIAAARVGVSDHNHSLVAALCSVLIVAIVPPVACLFEGGMSGGAPIYMLAISSYVLLVNSGLTQKCLIAATYVYYIAVYRWSYVRFADDSSFFDYIHSFIALALISVISAFLLQRLDKIIARERDTIDEQRSRIEKLLSAQSVFFSKMSHEIRTPINAIIGLNEITLRSGVEGEARTNALAINEASKILLSLVNDIIDVSKTRFGGIELIPSDYSTAEMLRGPVGLTRAMARDKGLQFSFAIDGSIPAAMFGDSVRLRQVLLNLLSNAVKYTPAGSLSLTVSSESGDGDSVTLIFEVSDTGIGIKHEDMSTLFNVFQRYDAISNRNVEGSGLGLAIVKNIVDLMGGTISVDSVYTKGSTFRVAVPQRQIGSATIDESAVMQDELAAAAAAAAARRRAQSHQKILIVDDNDVNRRVARDLLKLSGFDADTAASGPDALDKTAATAYDVILMDHFMPDMDGIETMVRIRAQEGGANRSTPMVALTANADRGEDFYRNVGFDAYLTKPILPEAMEQTIISLIPGLSQRQETNDASQAVTMRPYRRSKRRLMITAESTSDLAPEMIEAVGIAILPVHIDISDGRSYLDGREIDHNSLGRCLEDDSLLVRTSSPTHGEYERFFADCLMEADRVIHITLPMHDPGNDFTEATDAASSFDSVDVVPAGAVSTGHGLLAYMAAQQVTAGTGRDELLEYIDRMKRRISFNFLAGSPEQLSRSHRIPSLARTVSNALMLRPAVTYIHGTPKIRRFEIGNNARTRKRFIERTLHQARIAGDEIYLTYAGIELDEVESMIDTIRGVTSVQNIRAIRASAGVFANSGIGSAALTYQTR